MYTEVVQVIVASLYMEQKPPPPSKGFHFILEMINFILFLNSETIQSVLILQLEHTHTLYIHCLLFSILLITCSFRSSNCFLFFLMRYARAQLLFNTRV